MFHKVKKGFTLIEMMVVLGIIAILSLISVGALLANSNYQKLSRSAEEMVTIMRDAQNRSVAIVVDGSNETKAWEFMVDNTTKTYKIKALNVVGSALQESATAIPFRDQGSLPSGTTVSIDYFTGMTGTATSFYSVFTTPFARTYLGATNQLAGTGNCIWKDGGDLTTPRVAKDWFIEPACTSMLSPARSGYAKINLIYKGNTVTITVNTNGDISY